ncbi:thiopurine S-methyltransferase [Acidithiobacillus sp. CV18-2]|uniref:Thiopurine S-methyltransferase n=1 Tax=Igneacidithiobacillus copahuensis TaxID=2724909 RepID=A0AAE2YRA0_9PROT|nr:thiopurine S-methyltransferase [Igneacidithiobacillus copahuensis]MBU2755437.1 thiopurine S-methyltransferase [Acidithiobacillus sp. CV18-3]MBU2757965.1 thiopurine S-methyltransferase [Acidithiobacillus sp. BN09-2]MBU2777981.1 thiopurine S-methyltransferase [Acidithiobacillus sp. CV18-2]MBU2795821.1 thiopurine S-methyltransferase [Acidithiobacillus sp. VAN18-2]MBU2799358.1 thiopurine S-methyltransferase [Acidithiobacillus sp. VAN18-4]UTV80177.1 thiopurine S-methyltransferase [Acidithiobaci
MNAQSWLQRWQENRIGFHRSEFHPQLLRYWSQLGASGDGWVFVPLCGKSLDLLWLAKQGHKIRGVELSPIAVEAFFAEHGLIPEVEQQGAFQRYHCEGIEILCGDFFALSPADLADTVAVYDRAALIALPPEVRSDYVRKLHELLPNRPPILLITLDYPQDARDGPPFAVGEAEVHALYEPAWMVQKLERRDLRSQEGREELARFDELIFRLCRSND